MRTLFFAEDSQQTDSDTASRTSEGHNAYSNEYAVRSEDMDTTLEEFLNNGFFDNPAPPPEEHEDILRTPMWGAVESDLQMGEPLLMPEDLLLAANGPDLIEAAADATIDLGLLCDREPKREPRCSPSPDGSDSGVEAYSGGFEYCDSPPVTPPQAPAATASQVTGSATTIIRLIKQEGPPACGVPQRRLSVDLQPQAICVGPAVSAVPQKLPIPALPRTHTRRPGRGVRSTAAANAAPAATYIISGPAPVRPATTIRPRPVPLELTATVLEPASEHVTLGRRLSTRVTVPPTRAQMDPRALKRQERMIKNRMAACLSRKKRKDQFSEMEVRTKQLEAENSRLREENQQLHRQLAQLAAEVDMLRQSEAPTSPPPSPRRPLMLFSILLLAALNFAPLGSLWPGPLSDADRTVPAGAAAPGARTLLWTPSSDAEVGLNYLAEALNASSGYMCPKHVNQTEARRLSRVLHGWFDPVPARPDNASLYGDDARPVHRDTSGAARPARRRPRPRPRRKRNSGRAGGLQVYRPGARHGPYGRLLDAIRRRDDTFYVVSFNGDHLMLPALSHNQTQRPRMSLLLPSLPLNESMRAPEHYLAMMQIDCEVVNTKLLHIHESAVPVPAASADGGDREHFRFPSAPLGGFPTESALRWNESGSEKKLNEVRRPTLKKSADSHVTGKFPASSAPANATSDKWSKLKFGNYSVDGVSGDAAFGPSEVDSGVEGVGSKKLRHLFRRGRQRSNLTESVANSDYFESEH